MAERGASLKSSCCQDLLRESVEGLKTTAGPAAGLRSAEDQQEPRGTVPAEDSRRREELEASRLGLQRRIQEREEEVELLRRQAEAIHASAEEAVENVRLVQETSGEVKQRLRSRQQTAAREVKELQEMLEQEIVQLKRNDVQLEQEILQKEQQILQGEQQMVQEEQQMVQEEQQMVQEEQQILQEEQLTPPEDHSHLLHGAPRHSSGVHAATLRFFRDVAAVATATRENLQDVLRDELSAPQPETRAQFLRYSRQITLDPNTAHRELLLSDGDRKVTYVEEDLRFPDHPDRFTGCLQVLGREGLTGRCYWEVECEGGVYVAVAYKSISRSGSPRQCAFAFSDKSWALDCAGFLFWHDYRNTAVSGPRSSRVGVYLDHKEGILSFYSVSETMTLLHGVQTSFTQPLHAGVTFYFDKGASAHFLKPQ